MGGLGTGGISEGGGGTGGAAAVFPVEGDEAAVDDVIAVAACDVMRLSGSRSGSSSMVITSPPSPPPPPSPSPSLLCRVTLSATGSPDASWERYAPSCSCPCPSP